MKVHCKCPKCGILYDAKVKVFDLNPDKPFMKYCNKCKPTVNSISTSNIFISSDSGRGCAVKHGRKD